ncbi:MAG: DUF6404 family protein [Pseudomonadota bacterium]
MSEITPSKWTLALEEMESSGHPLARYKLSIWRRLPLYRRPPPYSPFLWNVAATAILYVVVYSPLRLLADGFDVSLFPTAIEVATHAAIIGLGLATYVRWDAKRRGLSRWEDL